MAVFQNTEITYVGRNVGKVGACTLSAGPRHGAVPAEDSMTLGKNEQENALCSDPVVPLWVYTRRK